MQKNQLYYNFKIHFFLRIFKLILLIKFVNKIKNFMENHLML